MNTLGDDHHAHCTRSVGTKMSVGIAGKGVYRTTLGRLRSIINITGRSTSLSMKITARGVVYRSWLQVLCMLELTMVMACK